MRKKPFWIERSAAASDRGKPTHRRAAWGLVVFVAVFLVVTYGFTQKAVGKNRTGAEDQAATVPAAAPGQAKPGLPRLNRGIGQLVLLDAPPPSAKRVTIGLFINNAYELDTKSNTYFLSGYIWLRWHGDFNPVSTLEFSNAVDEWSLTKTSESGSPTVLPDGSNYQIMRIQGRFFQPFDLRNYPLDQQELGLYVENNSETIDDVVYLPDRSSTGYDATLVIPGWDITGLNGNMYAHDYGTDFGETGVADASKYASLKFSLELRRDKSLFLWRLLLPLLIVLLTNWLALQLKPTLADVRTALPSTALLTTVFLQQASLNAIPEVPTLVLMDKIYALAYIFIILTFIQIIWANDHIDEKQMGNVAWIRKVERWSFAAQIVLFTFGLVLFILTIH
jgi:hypothetical protein